MPESVEDVFSLFSPADVRRTRDAALENFETLILAVTSRLHVLKNHPSFPDPELAPERDVLNCIRVLTRVLPFVYEAEHLSEWEDKFFWGIRRRKTRRAQVAGEVLFDDRQNDGTTVSPDEEEAPAYEEAKPLAEELIDTLTDLLFYIGFTIPALPQAKSTVTYAIWQSGVGCKSSIGTNKELDSNRCEVLRLLLTMTSKAMYMPAGVLPVQGVKAITYIATCPDKQIVLSILCSLLNTTIKYNSTSWRLPYDHVVWKDSKQSLVIYSLQFLLVLLLYPIPEEGRGPAPKNFYRHFLGRLHRPEDFQFLADGMTRVLSQPMHATASYLPGSQKSVKWAPEMIMLFWEVLQCNKRFRAFIIESNRAHDFIILMLFYAIEHKTDTSRQGIVRMCVFVLQTMSVEPAFGKNLNKKFEAQETLPSPIRLSPFHGTYADFLIVSIHTLITGSKGKLDAIYPALLAVINNIAAYVQNLSMTTCTRLLQLLGSMSTPSFLLANDSNHTLLQALLESINTIIEHQYTANANLIYAVLRSRKRIEALRLFTLEGGQQEMERAVRRRKELLDGAPPDTTATITATATTTTTATSPSLSAETLYPPTRSAATPFHLDAAAEGTFAIGDSEDDSDHPDHPTPSPSTPSAHDSRAPSIASSSAEDNVPVQLRGMSEKARGKLPAGLQTFSRQSSATSLFFNATIYSPSRAGFTPTPEWLESWLPELPLHTLITIIKVLSPHMRSTSSPPAAGPTSDPASGRPSSTEPDPTLSDFLQFIPTTKDHHLISAILASPSPIRVHLFEWSPLSLGWYMSVLWSLIFTAEMTIAPTSSTASTLTGGGGTAGPIGVWNGTHVKLFQVATEGKKEGPSLSQPRGAVDAVGSRLVQGVQGLNLGGLMGRVGSGGARALPHRPGDAPVRGTVREI